MPLPPSLPEAKHGYMKNNDVDHALDPAVEIDSAPEPPVTAVGAQGRDGRRGRRWFIVAGVAAAAVTLVAGVLAVRAGDDVVAGGPEAPTAVVPPTVTATAHTTLTTTIVPPPTTVPAGPTAAIHLAAFMAEAQANHDRLAVAVDALNGSFRDSELVIAQSTVDAIAAAEPRAARRAIPAGLDRGPLGATLLVYSGLESRWAAMRCFVTAGTGPYPRVIPRDSPEGEYRRIEECLRFDPPTAQRFPADLTALRAVSARTPMPAVAAPDSRAAAELAVHLQDIDLRNTGCDGNGGYVVTDLKPISWRQAPAFDPSWGARTDGDIDGLRFRADYDADRGWTVVLAAC
jgi:hypothetical protein